MPLSQRRITDAASLKALAHPTRVAILEVLVTEGARTATELGTILGESPANCSWHLRKLAEHGFVREAGGGAGRNRPWRAVSEGLTWGEADDEPAAAAAGRGLSDMLLEREVQRLRAAQAAQPSEPADWRAATEVVSSKMWLTAEEAAEVGSELIALFTRFSERIQEPETRPEGARLVATVGWVIPNGSHRLEADR